jgi:hypothetical protein
MPNLKKLRAASDSLRAISLSKNKRCGGRHEIAVPRFCLGCVPYIKDLTDADIDNVAAYYAAIEIDVLPPDGLMPALILPALSS